MFSQAKAVISTTGMTKTTPNEHHLDDLLYQLQNQIGAYSRQRLRALRMSLLHYSSGETRISHKDLYAALQENEMKLNTSTVQMMISNFGDVSGINFQELYECLFYAHSHTGRDSVLARHKQKMINVLPEDKRDQDLIKRIKEKLEQNITCKNIDELQKILQAKDQNKTGNIDRKEIIQCCTDLEFPIYGSLLKSLVTRLHSEKSGMVRWQDFINTLELAQSGELIVFPKYSTEIKRSHHDSKKLPVSNIQLNKDVDVKPDNRQPPGTDGKIPSLAKNTEKPKTKTLPTASADKNAGKIGDEVINTNKSV